MAARSSATCTIFQERASSNAVIIRALFGNLVARILTASRDGLRDESHRGEQVARTVRNHGMKAETN
jgi:hypothetical protein